MKELKFPYSLFCMFLGLSAFAVPTSALVVGPTPAGSPVTFVSASGTDTGSCSQTQPCATFQYAANVTLLGGEVDALTPGNFVGAAGLTIGQSITIDGKGMASISANTAQAITVNAIDSKVVLRGLSINGSGPYYGAPSGVEGIYYNSLGNSALVVEDCVIAGFSNAGIYNVTGATSTLYVKNTTISGGIVGVYVNEGGGSTVLEHVTISGAGGYGVEVVSTPGTLTMNDSAIVGGFYGVYVSGSAVSGSSIFTVVLERTTITAATVAGIYTATGVVDVDDSTIFANVLAMQASGGVMRISNNNIYDNATGIVCNSANSYVQSAGNNRHGSNANIITSGGCPAMEPINYW
jgi:hypothetical protein